MSRVHIQWVPNSEPVQLGSEVGRGGERAVSLVDGAPEWGAKIYLRPPCASQVVKLRARAQFDPPRNGAQPRFIEARRALLRARSETAT
jgi:DNA-binding helix-hairpin-helix protein with protein kinase domain